MNQKQSLEIFEKFKIRKSFDEKSQKWFFSVIDVVAALTEQSDYKRAKSYWMTMGFMSILTGLLNWYELKYFSMLSCASKFHPFVFLLYLPYFLKHLF